MRIPYCVGIDLGSTTTKSVVMGEDDVVLGRGITNSRSNYDVACKVAVSEALVNTRFALIEGRLAHEGITPVRTADLLEEFGLAFREEQYRSQLRALDGYLVAQAERLGMTAAATTIPLIIGEMLEESRELFSRGKTRKSDFFRDLAGSRYFEIAEHRAKKGEASFDTLIGLFDKAILDVENSTIAAGDFVERAEHALRSRPTDPVLTRAVEYVASVELVQKMSVGTGYGRQRLPFPEKRIRSEILCHGLGAHHMFPATRTVLDIGGQDTKAIQVDADGIVTSFQMNDRCAAGCGRYLGYIADEMNLGVHELGPLASLSTRKVRINSTCTVFAGAELRERLALGEKREDILAGLHRAIILRAMSLLARSGGILDEFTFTGGVAKNAEAVKALRRLVQENYGERTLNISPESIYTGALGAALFAWRDVKKEEPEALV